MNLVVFAVKCDSTFWHVNPFSAFNKKTSLSVLWVMNPLHNNGLLMGQFWFPSLSNISLLFPSIYLLIIWFLMIMDVISQSSLIIDTLIQRICSFFHQRKHWWKSAAAWIKNAIIKGSFIHKWYHGRRICENIRFWLSKTLRIP